MNQSARKCDRKVEQPDRYRRTRHDGRGRVNVVIATRGIIDALTESIPTILGEYSTDRLYFLKPKLHKKGTLQNKA